MGLLSVDRMGNFAREKIRSPEMGIFEIPLERIISATTGPIPDGLVYGPFEGPYRGGIVHGDD